MYGRCNQCNSYRSQARAKGAVPGYRGGHDADQHERAGDTDYDVVLIGGGIMSATLGAMLSQLQPDWSIAAYERLDAVALESSDAWNNA